MSTVTPQWKLRRFSPRAVRIVKRRSTQSSAVAAFLATLVPKAEGRTAVAALLKLIQVWLPLLKRDIPGFDGSGIPEASARAAIGRCVAPQID